MEKQTGYLSGLFYPNPFNGFSDPRYSFALRDIDRVGSDEEGMTVWPDPITEKKSQALHELTTRLLVESDPKKLDALIEQMTRIVESKILHGSQN